MNNDVVINANHWGLIFIIISLASPFLLYILRKKNTDDTRTDYQYKEDIKELALSIKENVKVTQELSLAINSQRLSCDLIRKPIEKKLDVHDKEISTIKDSINKHETCITLIKKDIEKYNTNETTNSH